MRGTATIRHALNLDWKWSIRYSGEQLVQKSTDAVVFMLFHEVGHALKHQYQLKLPGNEESVVDEFATYLLAGNQNQAIEEAAFSGAEAFAAMASDLGTTPYWDEHPLSEQRFYDVLCKLYGKNPAKYQSTVTATKMGASRQVRCPNEYYNMMDNWTSILKPWFKH
jgi:hypothetical protein